MNPLPFHALGALTPGGAPPALSHDAGKGHLSVNPVYGCPVGCPFCISRSDGYARGVTLSKLASVTRILHTLQAHAEAIRPLKLSLLDFSDPFLGRNAQTLRDLLKGLDRRLPGQPVHLTSRLHPGEATLDRLAGLRGIRLSVFVSLGDATGAVRPVTPVRRRLSLLTDCRARGIHTVMLLRPLVREWTRGAVLRRLLRHARATCHEVVLAGLTRTREVDHALRRARWPRPAIPADPHGGVAPGFREQVLAAARESLGAVPLSEHRSCAVNRRFGLACKVVSPTDPAARRAPRGPAPAITACLWCINAAQSPPSLSPCGCRMEVRAPDPGRIWRDDRGYCYLRSAA